jgi:hypothetical protein
MQKEIKNAIISAVNITTEDRGVLDCWLHLDYSGSGRGFGGYALYLPKDFTHHKDKGNIAGHHIYRCMEIAGVTKWDNMKGKSIRVCIENGIISGIGHIIKDDWYYPSVEFKEFNVN